MGPKGVKVGSTELFQGQERRVIVVSTVRSSDAFVASDRAHNLGFLDNPKRFNVAVTRAQALLVVVMNPLIVATDPHWGALLKLCVEKGAYAGLPLPPGLFDNAGFGDDADEVLARALGDLLLEPSARIQQEGMEMPSHE